MSNYSSTLTCGGGIGANGANGSAGGNASTQNVNIGSTNIVSAGGAQGPTSPTTYPGDPIGITPFVSATGGASGMPLFTNNMSNTTGVNLYNSSTLNWGMGGNGVYNGNGYNGTAGAVLIAFTLPCL